MRFLNRRRLRLGEEDLLREQLFGRPSRLKVFVSSQMRRRVLEDERRAAVEAVEGTGFAMAWHWERDAHAGPYSSENVCLGQARTSDGLILLLARQLTPITQAEYEAASANGVPCYMFLKQISGRQPETQRFIEEQRDGSAVTKDFANVSELKTQITDALLQYTVQSVRRENLRRRTIRRKRAFGRPRRGGPEGGR